MKTWEMPTMEELNINETMQGGSTFDKPDKSYIAEDGYAYTSYAPLSN